jgi:hypothetical protein
VTGRHRHPRALEGGWFLDFVKVSLYIVLGFTAVFTLMYLAAVASI